MIKYIIVCPNCGKTKTFEKKRPSQYERQFCSRSCGSTYCNLKSWADLEVRARRLTGMAKAVCSDEYIAKQKAAWASEERREAAAKRARKYLPITIHQPGAYEKMCKTKRDKEHRDLAKQQAHKRWDDPEFHAAMVEITKESHNTPEYLEEATKRATCQWADPEIRARRIKARNKPSTQQAIRQSMLDLWANPEWAMKQSRLFNRRPNKMESMLLEFLGKNKLGYTYVGDGSFWIGGKNPDFINCRKKTIIEFYGRYWHDESEVVPRKEHFANHGFKTLIIWSEELDNHEQILAKVKKFHQGIKFIE